jgi:hypothetical protein
MTKRPNPVLAANRMALQRTAGSMTDYHPPLRMKIFADSEHPYDYAACMMSPKQLVSMLVMLSCALFASCQVSSADAPAPQAGRVGQATEEVPDLRRERTAGVPGYMRTRDIERSDLHEDECHAQCDRNHNLKSFDEDG